MVLYSQGSRGHLFLYPFFLFYALLHFNIMAIIKFGSLVTSASGSIGGSTIQGSRQAPIMRNKPQQTYSCTAPQALIRGYNKTMQAGWRALSDQDRKIWNHYAEANKVGMLKEPDKVLSGHSLWMKYQYDALSKGAPFMPDPSEYPGPYLGPELIKNGSFDSGANWNLSSCWSIFGGKIHYNDLSNCAGRQNVMFTLNDPYRVAFDISNATPQGHFGVSRFGGGLAFSAPLNGYLLYANGIYSFDVTCQVATIQVQLYATTAGSVFSLDNFSVKRIYC